MKKLLIAIALTITLASPLLADEIPQDATKTAKTAVAAWVAVDGTADQGAEYTLLEFASPVRKGKMWRVSLLVGTKTGGAGVSTDVATQMVAGKEARIAIGVGAVAKFTELQQGKWKPVLLATIRF